MNSIQLIWKNITQQWGSTLLSILLTSFGVSILVVIYIASDSFEKQLENNSKSIDLVVGAKGSPLQLILSSVYHLDHPTGNILLKDALSLRSNPLVDIATPISLGDNYLGHRIIGTDSTFFDLYDLELNEGDIWSKSYEIVLGSETAKKNKLKIGDKIHSAHGLSAEGHVHDDHPFSVVGILARTGSVVDNLLLCDLKSIWDAHGIPNENEELHAESIHDHDHDHQHPVGQEDKTLNNTPNLSIHSKQTKQIPLVKNDSLVKNIAEDMHTSSGLEVTSMLIRYRSPAAIGILPKMINQSTTMQAASPAMESARLFSLLGVGIDSLEILAYIIMTIAGLSIFISLYNAMKERKYDLALMRTLGAGKLKLFGLVLLEGLVITLAGGLIGLVVGHLALFFINQQTSQSTDFVDLFRINVYEWLILLSAVLVGLLAAILPALRAYQTNISTILRNK